MSAGLMICACALGACADSSGPPAARPAAATIPASRLAAEPATAPAPASAAARLPGELRWAVESIEAIGGNKAQVLGAPKVVTDMGGASGKSVSFDGVRDGLILPVVPLAGMKSFTLEVLFSPESGGPTEQRFMHSEDEAGNRFTVETRLVEKNWYLDTFLLAGGTGGGRRTLIDATKLHPADQWYWVALRYDGTTMSDFVNGVKEGEGPVVFGPMGPVGRVSLGVRLNQVNWFKGQIKEVRIVPRGLAEGELQKVEGK